MGSFTAKAVAKKLLKPSRSTILNILAVILVLPSLVFSILALAGCISTSPTIPSLYLVSLQNSKVAKLGNDTQIRLGFFGICGVNSSGDDDSDAVIACVPTAGRSASDEDFLSSLPTKLFPESEKTAKKKEVQKLIEVALSLQNGIFVSPLAGGAAAFLLGLVFVFIHKRSLRKAEFYSASVKWIKRSTYALLVVAVAGTGGSALAITQAADALQYASLDNSVIFRAGKTVQVFQWIAFGCEAAFLLLVPLLVKPYEKVEGGYDKEYV
ncbi:hypothetical protein QBC43DRAFT_254539 [Cladorrhinum sp. PSN259]|nr:hypothetical protein QBC43DRAFT_254539 [Cladorrhinum sp. PSN259]